MPRFPRCVLLAFFDKSKYNQGANKTEGSKKRC